LQHYGAVATRSISWFPGWAAGVVLLLALAFLAWRAFRQMGWIVAGQNEDHDDGAGLSRSLPSGDDGVSDGDQTEVRRDTLEQQHS